MEKINLINNICKKIFNTKYWFALFPFAIVSLFLLLVYYILASIYLLFDIIKLELKFILLKDSDNESNGVQIVKYLFGFFYVVYFNLITVIIAIPLGIIYYLIAIMIFVSSLGRVKTSPFGFHTIANSKSYTSDL